MKPPWHNSLIAKRMSNREIRRLLGLYAELLVLHRQDEKLAADLSSAAYYLRNFNQEIESLSEADLAKSFRPAVTKILRELRTTGSISTLEELIQLTPPGLFELMRIKGLGGKKLSVIWHTLSIDTLEGLLEACQNGALSKLPGFGKKTEDNIINAIESYSSQNDFFRYAAVAPIADNLVKKLQRESRTALISLCGDVRRKATTLARIELISSTKLDSAVLKKHIVVQSDTATETRAITIEEIPLTIFKSNKKNFYSDLFRLTGNKEHVSKVLSGIKKDKPFNSEEAIYKEANLPFIVPEMREDNAEWNFKSRPEELITMDDIKGVVHNHTTWSDGVDSLEDFVDACIKKGYEYCVISDHSKNAHYARGLKEEKLLQQVEKINMLNKKLAPFRIFKSVECDILVSGELDYEPAILKKLDLVIVSIHQLLKMDEEKATKRLIKAIENPFTTILGHMTGRQLLIRPGYPVNFKKVIEACAANNVVIEINANPYRLDMDWSHIPYALKKGVKISINPDSHSIYEIDNTQWGIAAARKGGLTKEMTWNAQTVGEITKWLANRKRSS